MREPQDWRRSENNVRAPQDWRRSENDVRAPQDWRQSENNLRAAPDWRRWDHALVEFDTLIRYVSLANFPVPGSKILKANTNISLHSPRNIGR